MPASLEYAKITPDARDFLRGYQNVDHLIGQKVPGMMQINDQGQRVFSFKHPESDEMIHLPHTVIKMDVKKESLEDRLFDSLKLKPPDKITTKKKKVIPTSNLKKDTSRSLNRYLRSEYSKTLPLGSHPLNGKKFPNDISAHQALQDAGANYIPDSAHINQENNNLRRTKYLHPEHGAFNVDIDRQRGTAQISHVGHGNLYTKPKAPEQGQMNLTQMIKNMPVCKAHGKVDECGTIKKDMFGFGKKPPKMPLGSHPLHGTKYPSIAAAHSELTKIGANYNPKDQIYDKLSSGHSFGSAPYDHKQFGRFNLMSIVDPAGNATHHIIHEGHGFPQMKMQKGGDPAEVAKWVNATHMKQPRTEQVADMEKTEEAAPHAHHWVLPPPAGKMSIGTCKGCGETKDFPNYNPTGVWDHSKAPGRNFNRKTPRPAGGEAQMKLSKMFPSWFNLVKGGKLDSKKYELDKYNLKNANLSSLRKEGDSHEHHFAVGSQGLHQKTSFGNVYHFGGGVTSTYHPDTTPKQHIDAMNLHMKQANSVQPGSPEYHGNMQASESHRRVGMAKLGLAKSVDPDKQDPKKDKTPWLQQDT